MSVVQVKFEVSSDIMPMIEDGTYQITGGVVRDNKGRIKTHLPLIDCQQVQNMSAKVLQLASNYRTPLGIVVCVSIGVGIVSLCYEVKIQSTEKSFRADLDAYLTALRNGNLEIAQIDNLMASLDTLKRNPYFKKRGVKLSLAQLDAIVTAISEYTTKLVTDNSLDLTATKNEHVKDYGMVIINLQQCLQTQKRVFESAT